MKQKRQSHVEAQRRKVMKGVPLCVFWLVILLVGCTSQEPEPVVEAMVQLPTAVPTLTLPTPTLQPTNTAVTLPTQTSQPTAVPHTPTPNPPIVITGLAAWEDEVITAIQQVQSAQQPWHFLPAADPAAELAAGSAQMMITEDGSGTLIYQEPIALTVPFTSDFEATTLAEGQLIAENGHNFVEVVLWSAMEAGYKALRVDGVKPGESGYPLQKRLGLTAVSGLEAEVAEIAPHLQAVLQPDETIHVTAVGDIMLDRGPGFVISQGNLAYPFAKVAHLFHAADLVVGNVESALGDIGEPAPKSYPFQAPPEAAEALALAGFDVVSLANNHGMDYGPEALMQAIQLLQAQNVKPIGAGANRAEAHAPFITTVNGLTVAVLAYVNVPVEALTAFDVATWDATDTMPGLAWGEPDIVAADVTAVRDQVDLVVVVLHSGFEYIEEPSEPQAAISHAAIDAGADLVIGHHAHILQGVEFYNEGVIVYGLGNFAFEIDGDPNTAVLNVWLDKDGVREVELIPAIIQEGGQPRLAEAWEAQQILQRVYFLTTILNSQ